jgi:two-component sensor histidine kinase
MGLARTENHKRTHRHSRSWPALSLSLAVAVLGIAVSIRLFHRQVEYEREQMEGWTALEADALVNDISEALEPQVLALVRMAERWRRGGGISRSEWEADAKLLVEHSAAYQAIGWVDPSFHVRWIVPLEGNEAARGVNLGFEQRRRTALEVARDRRQVTVTRSVELVQGGIGILVYVPLYLGDEFGGFIGGVSRVHDFFEPMVADVRDRGFDLAVFDGEELIYGERRQDGDASPREVRTAEFYDTDWRIVVAPTGDLLARSRSDLATLMLPVSVAFTIVFAASVGLWQAARVRVREAIVANRELDHRVKNTLATVQAVADQTLASSPSWPAFESAFRGRIQALAAIHEALARTKWGPLDLADLVALTVSPYGSTRDSVHASGPRVDVPADAVRPLGLALHELATNATKHGALSSDDGRVDLAWTLSDHIGERQLSVVWKESGGPLADTPGPRSFGLSQIERTMPYELEGTVRLTFEKTGIRCVIEIPLPAVRA